MLISLVQALGYVLSRYDAGCSISMAVELGLDQAWHVCSQGRQNGGFCREVAPLLTRNVCIPLTRDQSTHL
jgi:hypothetical protein